MHKTAITDLGVEFTTDMELREKFEKANSCYGWRGPSGCRAMVERFYRGFRVPAALVCIIAAPIVAFLDGWLAVICFPREAVKRRSLISWSLAGANGDRAPLQTSE
jgi:hypothetical protein